MWTACPNGMDGCWFPLCSNTAFRLSFEESIHSHDSCRSCLIPRTFIYIVAEYKVIFLSEERHQLLMTNAKRRNSDFFSRRFHCLSLDPSNCALLLDSSRSRTRSFSSSCMRVCGCGAEDLPWETCGSVDTGGPEPEVGSPSSSSSESMVNSFGDSGTEIPSLCGTGRRADGIFGHTTVRCFFFMMPPETRCTI